MNWKHWLAAVALALVFMGIGTMLQQSSGAAPANEQLGNVTTRLAQVESVEGETTQASRRAIRRLGQRMDKIEEQLERIALAVEAKSGETLPDATSEEAVEPNETDSTSERLERLAKSDAKYALDRTATVDPLPGKRRFDKSMAGLGAFAVLQNVVPVDLDEALEVLIETEVERLDEIGADLSAQERKNFEGLARAYWPKIATLQRRQNRFTHLLRAQPDATDKDRAEWSARQAEIMQMTTDLMRTLATRTKDEVFSPQTSKRDR